MSNPQRQDGTPKAPANGPQGRPGQTQPGQSGRPQPPQSPPQPPPQGTQRQPLPPRAAPPRTTGSHGRPPASQQRQPIDLATRLDGQRGWLAQIERSLKKRSIIALVLTCLAVGVGAAALYVSLTKNADGDRIDALQTRVEALEAAAGIPPSDSTLPDTGTTLPDPGVPLPDTGTTLPDGTTVPPAGTTGGSGLETLPGS